MPRSNNLIIAITGPSGAGKSTFANALQHTLQQELSQQRPTAQVAVIREDAYYRDQAHLTLEQRQHTDYDHPDALEHSLLLAHLNALANGKTVEIPVYDYAHHTRSHQTCKQLPVDVLILEGILLFSNPDLLHRFDLRLFVDTPLQHCLQRRIARDTVERGRTQPDVEAQFEQCVVPMYRQYLDVWQQNADLVIDGRKPTAAALELVMRKLSTAAKAG